MKHAILILVHKDIAQVCNLISYFHSQCEIFIHVDKKSSLTKDDLNVLRNQPNVSGVYREYAVHWAGFSILKCELFLLKQALRFSNADYFHLISGQDYPIKPFSAFLEFFEKNGDKEYLSFRSIPNLYWEGRTYDRFQYFFLNDWFDVRSFRGKKIVRTCLKWQKRLGIKRRIPDQFEYLYGGSAWFSITRKGGETLLEYTRKHPAFYRRLKHTFVPEETYVPTVLVNLLPDRVINNNYRFVQWVNSFAANLTKEYLFKLIRTDAFFARKFDYPSCGELVSLINRYVLPQERIVFTETGSWGNQTISGYAFDLSLSKALLRLSRLMQIDSVVDMGCGGGMYVATLRRKGISIVGYDGNPCVREQSSLLLQGDNPCRVADLTERIELDQLFDMVLCLDVCHYIPAKYEDRVIRNIVTNSGKYVVLSWATPEQVKEGYVNTHPNEYVIRKFAELGFRENISAKNYLREQASLSELKETLFVFQK